MADCDVVNIDDAVGHLFALVADGVLMATESFLSSDRIAARDVTANEQLVDSVYSGIERMAHDELLHGVERSEDRLRGLLLVLQVVPEIERSGDLVEHIAIRANQGLARDLSPAARGMIQRMGEVAGQMWRLASLAYLERNPRAAVELRLRDDELDDLHVCLTSELSAGSMPVAVAIEMGLVARFFERLGDHAVNVSRRLEAWSTRC